jgi:hypothetical protein
MKTIIIPITLRLRFEEPPKLTVPAKRHFKIKWKPNTFKRWTTEDYRKILTTTDKKSVKLMAKKLGRTPAAVTVKRRWLTKGAGKKKIKL